MPMPRLLVLCAVLSVLLTACDNVGRAFDPDTTPIEPGPGTSTSIVEVVPIGGDSRDGRPRVRATFPKDGGWPATVPVVVEFSESVNQASIAPTSAGGLDGRIVLRVQGTTQALPCQYDFLANGRLLVLRPATALSNNQTPTYEVVLLPDARDADGVRFDVPTGGTVLSEFQVNQDSSFADGRILTTFPRDNQRDAMRENGIVVVFDRPANASTLVAANLLVRPQGGVSIVGQIASPLVTVGVADPRVVTWTPDQPLAGDTWHELVVTAAITFGQEGELDFRGRTPFSRFQTIGPEPLTAIALADPVAGFPNKINIANLQTVRLRATTPASAQPGDRVRVRVYGGDALTAGTGDLAFVERLADVPGAGVQTVDVDFAGGLGTVTRPKFDDGSVVFTAQLQRGSQFSGFARIGTDANARFDVTPPTLVRAGPPSSTDGTDIVCDTESLAFFGTASEQLAAAALADGASNTATLFGSDTAGRFVMTPVPLGRLGSPRTYSLTLTDLAGNLSAGAAAGNIVQRGRISGTLVDTLVVEAYDQVTLRPIANASVLVDVGTPVVPASGQLLGTTGVDGRVTFPGLLPGEHTVTIVRSGYDLVTLYGTLAANVSLPLRPTANATATLQGTVTFAPSPGTTVVVGCNSADDRSVLGTRTTNAAPSTIQDLAIVPNRMSVLTAFASPGEPTSKPTFGAQGAPMLGATLVQPSVPVPPPEPGATTRQSLVLLPATSAVGPQIGAFTEDWALAVGLDTANLVDSRPLVRVHGALQGFEGQVIVGLGFATSAGGAAYAIDSTWGLPLVGGFLAFAPLYFVTSEARDTSGRISRHRALLDTTTGAVQFPLDPPPIPVPTLSGAASAAPLLDVVDVLDATLSPGGIALLQVTARAADGRSWRLIAPDRDAAAGTKALQFPDLQTNNVAGLSTGTWTIVAEARLAFSVTGGSGDELVLSERHRAELLYARSATLAITVP